MAFTTILLSAFMTLFPAGFLAWYTRRPVVRDALQRAGEDVQAAARAHGARAMLLTLLCCIVVGGLIAIDANTGATFGVASGAFHLVWWTAVAPVLRRTERPAKAMPGLAAPSQAPSPRRTASLAARRNADYLPASWMALPIGIFAVGMVLIVREALTGGLVEPGSQLIGWLLPAGALGFLVGWGLWARQAVKSPQDLSGAVDPHALAEAFDGFRRFLARGIYGVMTTAVLVFMGTAVAVVMTQGGPALQSELGAWIGGGGGALVGLLGGLFGTLCSLKRMQLERVRREGAGGSPASPNPA